MSQYFPKPYKRFGGDINDNVDLFIYVTKTDFKKRQEVISLMQHSNQI